LITEWFAAPKQQSYTKHWPAVVPSTAKTHKAQKQGITVEEYDKRCAIVEEALVALEVNVGDYCYPPNQADFEQHGKCIVTAIARSYDDYGRLDWDPNKLFLVHFRDEHGKIISCTTNYLSKVPPTSSQDSCQC